MGDLTQDTTQYTFGSIQLIDERSMTMNKILIMGIFSAAAFTLTLATPLWAAIRTEVVTYYQGDVKLVGYLAYDETVKGPCPAVLVIHEWWGVNDYVKKRADQLASLGYIAFAADIYGNGTVAADPQEAGALAGKFRNGDRKLLRERANAGLQVLLNHPLADKQRIVAIGYCFGGTTVLELARSGAPLAGVVSFHGGLDTPNPADAKNIKARVLVLHGADDPNVPAAQVAAFAEEMRTAKVDWQMIAYGGAVHSFSNPASGSDPSKGVAYNEKADKRSWEHMKVFFAEIFR
jgi:dienelactone hydrolase